MKILGNIQSQRRKEEIKEHSWHIVVLLVTVTIGGAILIGLFVERNLEIRAFDAWGYETLIHMPHPAWLNTIIWPFNFNFLPLGSSFTLSFLIIIIALFLTWIALFHRKLFPLALLSIIFGFIYGNILYDVISAVAFRARPFTVLPNNLTDAAKNAWIAWNSFPSGHTRDTAMYSTIIASYLPKLRWILVLFSLFIAFTRVYLGAHYPTDVIAGLIVGYLAGRSAVMVAREVQLLFNRRQVRQHGDRPVEPPATP